jgi:hydrogenase small subunit
LTYIGIKKYLFIKNINYNILPYCLSERLNISIYLHSIELTKTDRFMENKQPSFYEEANAKGISRKDFLKFCATMTAMLGLESSSIGQIVKALDSKPRLPVIWFHFQECTCCSESFIRASHPLVATIVLDKISLDYQETLMAASGVQAEEAYKTVMEKNPGGYIVMVEGSIPTENEAYCCIGGRSALQILEEAVANCKAVVAWGNCASAGCVQAASPNPTGAKPVHKVISGKPVINVQGCPPIADVMAGVVVHLLTFDRIPQLDALGRPKAFYSRRVHDTCYRRANFDAGLFVESFDDDGAKRGYCLYKMGCKGPVTYNSCGIIKWNDGLSYPIQSGHPCIGCSEAGFWDNGPFYQHLPSVGGFGIETTADKLGVGLGVATVVGVAAHAVVTNIRKHKEISNAPETSSESETPKVL